MNEFVIEVNSDNVHCVEFPSKSNKVIIFAPGVGIRKTFYYPFLRYLNDNGYTVFTLDYRGVAQSRFIPLKQYKIKLIDWVDDLSSLIAYADKKYSSAEFIYIAHSFGGQIFGFLPTDRFNCAVMINSQNGYWRYYRHKTSLFLFWKLLFPILVNLLGYFPGKKLKLGSDLPFGVAYQWRKWCLSPNYLFDDSELNWEEHYKQVKTPILAYATEDDEYGGEDAVQSIQSHYSNSTIITLHPSELGVPRIGHIGFFRMPKLWSDIIEWIDNN